MKHQWMPLFWGDFLANTMHLSAQEVGAYVLLIAHAWEHNGCITHAHAQRIARLDNRHWLKVWKKLAPFFEPTDGHGGTTSEVRHPRVAKELAIAAEMSNKRKGAALQMHANRHARAMQVHPPHTTPLKKESRAREKTPRSLAGAPAGALARSAAPSNPTKSVELQMAAKQHLGISPDEGPEHRSPPRARPEHAHTLEPIPDRLVKRPSDEDQNFAPGTLPQCGQCNCPISPSGEQKCWAKILANSTMGKLGNGDSAMSG